MEHKKKFLIIRIFAIIGFTFAIPAGYSFIYLKDLMFYITFPISLICILTSIAKCINGIGEIVFKAKANEA